MSEKENQEKGRIEREAISNEIEGSNSNEPPAPLAHMVSEDIVSSSIMSPETDDMLMIEVEDEESRL